MFEEYQLNVIFLLAFLLILFLSERRRGWQLDFVSMTTFSMMLMYGVVGCILLLFPAVMTSTGNATDWTFKIGLFSHYAFESTVFVFLFGLSYSLTGLLIPHKKIGKWGKKMARPVIEYWDMSKLKMLAILLGIVGVISFFLYARSMGGPVQAIVLAQAKRSGLVVAVAGGTFFKHFMRAIFFTLFMFLSFQYLPGYLKKRGYGLLKIVLGAATFIVLWTYASRGLMVVVLSTSLLFPYLVGQKKVSKKIIIQGGMLVVAILLIIGFMRPLIVYMAGGTPKWGSSILAEVGTRLIKGLSSPTVSLLVFFDTASMNETFVGKGFLMTFQAIIPKTWLGVNSVFTVNRANTEAFGFVTDQRVFTVTAGMLAYYAYEFFFLGCLIGGTITRVVAEFVNALFVAIKKRPEIGALFSYFLVKIPVVMLNGDPASFIMSDIMLIAAVLHILFWPYFRLNLMSADLQNKKVVHPST